jgi:hypothetical protein
MIGAAEAFDCAGDLLERIASLPIAAQLMIAELLVARIMFELPEPEKSEVIEPHRRHLGGIVNEIGAFL